MIVPMIAPTDPSSRFGMTIAGVNLLMPAGRAAEFLVAAPVYPLPMAPRRIRGVTQLRGLPVLVFDAGVDAPAFLPSLARRSLLVLEDEPDAFALLTDVPPRAVGTLAAAGPVPRPDVPFGAALRQAQREQRGDGVEVLWWQTDFEQLFGMLASER